MKKLIALLLLVATCLSMTSCGIGVLLPFLSQKNEQEETSEEENKYQALLRWEESYPYHSFYDENNEYKNAEASIKYAYELAKELIDYKDGAEYYSRFTVVKDTLSHVSKLDAFGQVEEEKYKKYSYSNDGACFELSAENAFLTKIGVKAMKHLTKFTYNNETGAPTKVTFYSSSDFENAKINCQVTFVRDDKGNITKANFKKATGETWTNTFAYNDKDQRIEADITKFYDALANRASSFDGYTENYEYDATGNLVKIFRQDDYMEERLYNAKGLLVELKRFGEKYWGSEYDETEFYKETYAYDKTDRITSIEVVDQDETHTLKYRYEDIYVYDRNK